MVMVVIIAALAALSRILYGKEELRWRYTTASVMVAMMTAVLVYGAMVHQLGEIGGHASAAIGSGCGLFTDDALRRIHSRMVQKALAEDRREHDN